MNRKTRGRGSWRALSAVALAAIAGCAGATHGNYGDTPPNYRAALAGAPRPLARLYSQADELLGGGADAFTRRLASLRGHPVLVNKWASWCGPCRTEFPLLQKASARYGKHVAFLGVDSEDSNDAARTFLGEYRLPYPSFTDPDQRLAALFHATLGFPATAYYDAAGRLRYIKQGSYTSEGALSADILRYAR